MSESHRLLPAVILALATLLMSNGAVGAPSAVACRVLAASGAVFARNVQGHERPLHRRDRVYVGETLVTGSGGRVQVRFSDGGLVALPPSTALKVNSYHYDGAQDGTESEALHLIKGGMRAISGAIGHKHHKRYGVKAGTVATIGIRGTDYVLQLCNGGCGKGDAKGLYGGVLHGKIVVKNGSGTTPVSTNQYFRVANARSAPQRLLAPPAFLARQSVPRKKKEENKKGESKKGTGEKQQGKKKGQGSSSSTQEKGKGKSGNGKKPEANGQSQSSSGNGKKSSSSSISSSSSGSTMASSTGSSDETSTSGGTTATTTDTTTDASTDDASTTLLDPATTANTTQATSDAGSGGIATLISGATSAPSTGGIGVSFIKSGSASSVNAVAGVVTSYNGGTALLLNTVGGVGNVPVYASVTDPDQSHPEACNPCSFSVGSGTLSHVGGVGGTVPVNWGRWDTGYVVTENGAVDSTVGGFSYIYSPAMTTPTQLASLTGSFTYALPTSGGHGTGLVDESGGTGQLSSLTVGVDFSNKTFTSASLATNTFSDGRQFSMHLDSTSPTDFNSIVNNQDALQLTGTCTGGSCGSSTTMGGNLAVGFAGPHAERMLTSVGLRNHCGSSGCNSTIAVSGTAVLNK